MRRHRHALSDAMIPASATLVLVALVVGWAALARPTNPPQPAQAIKGPLPLGVSFGDRLRTASDDELNRALDDVVSLYASWIRVDLSWNALEPREGVTDWAGTDRLMDAAAARGIEVLGVIGYTPAWAREPSCDSGFNCPPASTAAFASFAGRVAERYRDRGLRTFEVWNEPNLPLFWASPNPAVYRDLLVTTAASIRAASPASRILFGGLSNHNPQPGTIEPAAFLAAVCAAGPCPVNGVAFHPYTTPRLASDVSAPVTGWARMTLSGSQPSLHQVMTDAGLTDARIWITEYGAPTGGNGREAVSAADPGSNPVDHVSEAVQAQIVASGIEQSYLQRDLVGGFFVYTWRDLDYYHDREDHFGLVRLDGSRKPAFDAFRRSASGLLTRE